MDAREDGRRRYTVDIEVLQATTPRELSPGTRGASVASLLGEWRTIGRMPLSSPCRGTKAGHPPGPEDPYEGWSQETKRKLVKGL